MGWNMGIVGAQGYERFDRRLSDSREGLPLV